MSTDETAAPLDSIDAHDPQVMDFCGLRIAFDARVLRPRPWTEGQSRWAAELLEVAPEGPVLELCAGAGHIGLAAVVGSGRRLVAVEQESVAAAYTATNATSAGIADLVEVREGPMDSVLHDDERFAVVIADPPYLLSTETWRYPEDPVGAVDGGDDGLALVRQCLRLIDRHLAPGGSALLQLRDQEQAGAAAGQTPETLRAVELRAYDGEGVVIRVERTGVSP